MTQKLKFPLNIINRPQNTFYIYLSSGYQNQILIKNFTSFFTDDLLHKLSQYWNDIKSKITIQVEIFYLKNITSYPGM